MEKALSPHPYLSPEGESREKERERVLLAEREASEREGDLARSVQNHMLCGFDERKKRGRENSKGRE